MDVGHAVAPRLSEAVKLLSDVVLMPRLKLKQQTISAAKVMEAKEANACTALASQDLTLESLQTAIMEKIGLLWKQKKGARPKNGKDGTKKRTNHTKPPKTKR